jgi:hypothetical protein
VLVLGALGELRETTKALDEAKRGFERATIALAALGVLIAAVTLTVSL